MDPILRGTLECLIDLFDKAETAIEITVQALEESGAISREIEILRHNNEITEREALGMILEQDDLPEA